MEENNFQYTLPSNSSSRYFPGNKPNQFQINVPHPISLSGEWEVALIDIQYHATWLTLEEPQYFILWMQTEDDKIFNLLYDEAAYADSYYLSRKESSLGAIEVNWSTRTYAPFKPTGRLSPIISLPAGNYDSISDCLTSLNNDILLFWSYRNWPHKREKHKDLELSFHFNPRKRHLSVTQIGFKSFQLVSTDRTLLSNLGFRYIKTHRHKALNGNDKDRTYYIFNAPKADEPKLQSDLKNNFMYIHFNLIQHQNIANTRAQILAIVPVRTAQGGQSYWKCDPPFYLPLRTKELHSLEIKIENEKGELFPFTPNSNLIIRLHFRRRPHTI